jgi:hypothetical protein
VAWTLRLESLARVTGCGDALDIEKRLLAREIGRSSIPGRFTLRPSRLFTIGLPLLFRRPFIWILESGLFKTGIDGIFLRVRTAIDGLKHPVPMYRTLDLLRTWRRS